jgi:hypothetical protein
MSVQGSTNIVQRESSFIRAGYTKQDDFIAVLSYVNSSRVRFISPHTLVPYSDSGVHSLAMNTNEAIAMLGQRKPRANCLEQQVQTSSINRQAKGFSDTHNCLTMKATRGSAILADCVDRRECLISHSLQ